MTRFFKEILWTFNLSRFSLPGFTLIEISIVMIIIGLLSGFGFPLLTNMLSQEKLNKTTQHQQYVMKALAAYVLVHHRLPCPARPDAPENEQGIAQERCLQNPTLCQGLVPYRTLGLSAHHAKDGFKNWMTYAVNGDLTDRGLQGLNLPVEASPQGRASQNPMYMVGVQRAHVKPDTFFCHTRTTSALKVVNEQEHPIFESTSESPFDISDYLAVVLISHGPQGTGAYLGNKTTQRHPVSREKEQFNSNDSLTFMDTAYQPHPETGFTHQVIWVTRNNFMAIYAHHPCAPRSASDQRLR